MINIVLCGGSGTRLWPLSRKMLPKQFVRLFNNTSLYQKTLQRNESLADSFMVVSNQEQYFLALDQLTQVSHKKSHYVLESVGRNTAPAIALAAMAVDREDIVLVTPSDHLITNQTSYEKAVSQAKTLAQQNFLVTFGIRPTSAQTGFGYIEAKGNQVLSFKEKPDQKTAQSYLNQGNYYWNSGMFCFKAGVYLDELQKYAPQIYQACQKAYQNLIKADDLSCIQFEQKRMQSIPEQSIDYAVIEHSKKVKVVPADMGWSDLGSFDALYDEFLQENSKNVVIDRSDNKNHEPIFVDSTKNLVISKQRQIALVDVNDLIVVDTSDAILISKKGSSQKVKKVVSKIQESNSELTEVHCLAHRPWGTYEILLKSEKYKLKRLVVKPNGRLSLQKHFHRNEHWIVVSGTATVTVENKTYLVRPNESTYINMGQLHRLENHGKIDLVMIEVQVGEYTEEDDIVRVDDCYGR